jgi:hypothetical protein
VLHSFKLLAETPAILSPKATLSTTVFQAIGRNVEDDRNARTGELTIRPSIRLARSRREQPADAAEQRCLAAAGRTDDAENLVASYVQLNVAKGDDCSFEEKLAGVINDDLSAISHRKALL